MTGDLPFPSKRPFDFPFPVKAWPYFVHPNKPALSRAYLHEDSLVFSNGFLAMQVDRFQFPPEPPDPAPAEFLERWSRAPWSHHEAADKLKHWRPLDDAGHAIWKLGPRPVWERGSKQYHIRRDPLVTIGIATVTQLALVQLCTRLPRAEAYTNGQKSDPVFIRFNGGRAILASFDHPDQALPFTILAPRRDDLSSRGMNSPL